MEWKADVNALNEGGWNAFIGVAGASNDDNRALQCIEVKVLFSFYAQTQLETRD